MIDKIKEISHKNDLVSPLISYEVFMHKLVRSIKNILVKEWEKELNKNMTSFNWYIQDIINNNYIPYISYIDAITEEWMKKHYLTHIILYFLGKKWILSLNQEKLEKSKEHISVLLLIKDKMEFSYDLYSMYLYDIKFQENIFNQKFLLKNQDLIHKILKDIYIDILQEWTDKLGIIDIIDFNINNISNNDQKQFDYLEKISDLLWILDIWFKWNFEISSSFFSQNFFKNRGSMIDSKWIYIVPIIYKIFWNKKSIKITKDNYNEIKELFKNTRVEYLNDLGVEDINDKLEIKKTINYKINKLARINTIRIRDPQKSENKDKKIQHFQRKITLLSKIIYNNQKTDK